MRHCSTDHRDPRRGSNALHLLLALMLTLAPLPGIAQDGPFPPAANGEASAQMPCHTSEAEPMLAIDTGQQDACPHCASDGAASQCHCCGYAAPAGLGFEADVHTDTQPSGLPMRLAATDPLPDASGDRLYRPPIVLS